MTVVPGGTGVVQVAQCRVCSTQLRTFTDGQVDDKETCVGADFFLVFAVHETQPLLRSIFFFEQLASLFTYGIQFSCEVTDRSAERGLSLPFYQR
jgi:hypothetical protein